MCIRFSFFDNESNLENFFMSSKTEKDRHVSFTLGQEKKKALLKLKLCIKKFLYSIINKKKIGAENETRFRTDDRLL